MGALHRNFSKQAVQTLKHLINDTTYKCDPSISCGCSISTTSVTSRIVGGEAASDYAWGWIVSLQENGQHICGATLLTSEYVVTAAHCVDDAMNNTSILSILAGINYLNNVSIPTIQRRSIISITRHPNYVSSDWRNDIAILKFSPLTTSSNSKIAFICLPKQDEDPFQTNADLVAIGWGYKSEFVHVLSDYLRQVTVQEFASTSTYCQESGMVDSSAQFCAGAIAGGKDACMGDSGGPLMAFVNNRWILAGITSDGIGCARAGYPGIYTRVSHFISFINSNVDFPVTQTTTVSLATSKIEHNYNQSSSQGNNGNMINKSITFVILVFSFLTSLLSYG